MKKNEKITFSFDTGIKEYQINDGGSIRFNPSDPNLYHRFKELTGWLSGLESEVKEKSANVADGSEIVELLSDYDRRVKEKLAYVFGAQNDFDAIFEGVNIMAISRSGEMVITNFLNALRPVIEDGVRAYAKMQAKKAVEEANRERDGK